MPKGANWRTAGINYVQYSNIAAQAVRRALRGEAREVAIKAEDTNLRGSQWSEGKQGTMMSVTELLASKS